MGRSHHALLNPQEHFGNISTYILNTSVLQLCHPEYSQWHHVIPKFWRELRSFRQIKSYNPVHWERMSQEIDPAESCIFYLYELLLRRWEVLHPISLPSGEALYWWRDDPQLFKTEETRSWVTSYFYWNIFNRQTRGVLRRYFDVVSHWRKRD